MSFDLNYHRDSNGKLHREDGPAIHNGKDTERWYREGKLHRTDGPAIITPWGEKWFVEGKRHRTDGPASVSSFKGKITEEKWFLNDKEVSWPDVARWNWENGNKEVALQIVQKYVDDNG
jgi:hypothetical protein